MNLGRLPILFLLFVIFVVISFQVKAIVPLEALITGEYNKLYSTERFDPLKTIFRPPKSSIDKKSLAQLAFLRGLAMTGTELSQSCQTNQRVRFASGNHRYQLKQTMMANLQYQGLDILIRALAQYAHYFDFNPDEYGNFVNRLTQNYCSKNITVVGIKAIKANFLAKYKHEELSILPDILGNPLFSKDLRKIESLRQSRKNEFNQTIKLFRALCSWSGQYQFPGLLGPLLSDPVIHSWLIHQMTGKRFQWKGAREVMAIQQDVPSNNVLCAQMICRPTTFQKFSSSLPRPVGGQRIETDLKRFYCQEFHQKKVRSFNSKAIKKWFEKENKSSWQLMKGQMVALITGVPNFLLWTKNSSQLAQVYQESVNLFWDNWSDHLISHFTKDMYYEESMEVEKVDRRIYFNPYDPNLKLAFDVNVGEFDRVNQVIGKIKARSYLKLPHNLLVWLKREWRFIDPRVKNRREELLKILTKHIQRDVEDIKSKFLFTLWKGNLPRIVARDLMAQLEQYLGPEFESRKSGMLKIPIDFHFGPFALKYIHHKFLYRKRAEQIKKLFKKEGIRPNS